MRLALAVVLVLGAGLGSTSTVAAQDFAAGSVPVDSASLDATPASEESATDEVVIYEREVFQYTAAGRPDPFRSLLLEGELGVRPEDLTLRGILYDPIATRSIAVLSQAGSERRIQLRVGESLGAIRILSIQPDRVEVVIEELGVSRRETLRLVRPQTGARP